MHLSINKFQRLKQMKIFSQYIKQNIIEYFYI